MEPNYLRKQFPIFNTTKPETLSWLLSIALQREYEENRTILLENTWGNAVYFLVDGWVKVRLLLESNSQTLAILDKESFAAKWQLSMKRPVPATSFLCAL